MLAFILIVMSVATAASLNVHGTQQPHTSRDSPFGFPCPLSPESFKATQMLFGFFISIISRNGKIKEPPTKGNKWGKYMLGEALLD